MPIPKNEQVDAIAAATGLTSRQAREALDAVVAVIGVGLLTDEKITVHGLGAFSVRDRSARRIRNPATGEMMEIPARKAITFKPSSELRKRVEG